jgi:hypothetical protein
VGVGVAWAPGEGEGDTIASSIDCILVVRVKEGRGWARVKGCDG